MADSQAGFPSRELGTDPIIKKRGSNQFLEGASHSGQSTVGPRGNKVQRLPRTRGPVVGKATAVQPGGTSRNLQD